MTRHQPDWDLTTGSYDPPCRVCGFEYHCERCGEGVPFGHFVKGCPEIEPTLGGES